MMYLKNFAYDEVIHETNAQLDDKTRSLAIISTLLGSQSIELYKEFLSDILNDVTSIEIKEVVYQSVAYLGIGRVYPFLIATNEVFMRNGITLPLEGQATTTSQTRRERGTEKQVELFGDSYRFAYQIDPQITVHIRR